MKRVPLAVALLALASWSASPAPAQISVPPYWMLTQGLAASCSGSGIPLPGAFINVPAPMFASERGVLSAPGFPNLGFTQDTNFQGVGTFGFFVFAHPSVPASNMAELFAYIRANPGKLNYGSGNSTSMLSTAQLVQREKLDVVHIPYKGDGPLSIDLLGGRVQFAIATPGAAAPQVKEGKLRVLAG